jgi:hypothetical protein
VRLARLLPPLRVIPVNSMKMAKTRLTTKRNTACLLSRHIRNASLILGLIRTAVYGQTAYTWQQLKDNFEAANPTLKAEITPTDPLRAGGEQEGN